MTKPLTKEERQGVMDWMAGKIRLPGHIDPHLFARYEATVQALEAENEWLRKVLKDVKVKLHAGIRIDEAYGAPTSDHY